MILILNPMSLTSYITLGKLLYLSEPKHSHTIGIIISELDITWFISRITNYF